MELIPILSFIILVATLSTFILAVGAYILYKIRESKGKLVAAPKPRAAEAELFAPAQALKPEIPVQQKQAAYQEQYYQKIPYDAQGRPMYIQQDMTQQNQMRAVPYQKNSGQQQDPQQDQEKENSTDKKFMKYTSEGYIPVSKTKTGDNLKWR